MAEVVAQARELDKLNVAGRHLQLGLCVTDVCQHLLGQMSHAQALHTPPTQAAGRQQTERTSAFIT
jgi:hypothetical protein